MKIGTIIFLLFIAWQVVAAVAKAAQQKKQEEAMRAAKQSGVASGNSPQQKPRQQPRSARERLEARRKAQIDELRAKRAARSQVIANPSAAPPSAEPPVDIAALTRARAEAEHRQQLQQRREARLAELRKKVQSQPTSQTQLARAADQQQLERLQKQQQAKAARKQARQAEAREERKAERIATLQARSKTGTPSRRIRGMLTDRNALRDAIVLREILDPPVAMREAPAAPW